jgi:hypothetical protein
LSGWRVRIIGTVAGATAALALGACGGGARQDASEPAGSYTVEVSQAAFPATQSLAQHAHFVLTVRNVESVKTIPLVAVTICNLSCAYPPPSGGGTQAQAFGENIKMQNVAYPSRPVWIVDRGPGPCQASCQSGGPGGAVTAYANTWALGPLKPGESKTFNWAVTAVKAGTHVVNWVVAAGLNGKAKAQLAGGGQPGGTVTVKISAAPQQAYVTDQGQVVKTPAH